LLYVCFLFAFFLVFFFSFSMSVVSSFRLHFLVFRSSGWLSSQDRSTPNRDPAYPELSIARFPLIYVFHYDCFFHLLS
jgi:hypothetical protein